MHRCQLRFYVRNMCTTFPNLCAGCNFPFSDAFAKSPKVTVSFIMFVWPRPGWLSRFSDYYGLDGPGIESQLPIPVA